MFYLKTFIFFSRADLRVSLKLLSVVSKRKGSDLYINYGGYIKTRSEKSMRAVVERLLRKYKAIGPFSSTDDKYIKNILHEYTMKVQRQEILTFGIGCMRK